jgi:hypothetical protein
MRARTTYYQGLFQTHDGKPVVEPLADRIKNAIAALEPLADRFDSIACTGVSGLVVAPAVSVALKKGLIIVRKGLEHTHSSCSVEGILDCRYIIIDDFTSTGTTVETIIDNIHRVSPESECVGKYFYNWDELKLPGQVTFCPSTQRRPTERNFPIAAPADACRALMVVPEKTSCDSAESTVYEYKTKFTRKATD